MPRVIVVGTTGSGKTTVAATLAQRCALPHIELDQLYWTEGWEPADPELFRDRIEDAITGDDWVVCGNYYTTTADITWPRADTVVWLDFPRSLVMRRVMWRTVRRVVSRRSLWNGNRETLRGALGRESIIRWAWQSHRRNHERYGSMTTDPQFASLHWIRLRSPDEVKQFLADLPSKGT